MFPMTRLITHRLKYYSKLQEQCWSYGNFLYLPRHERKAHVPGKKCSHKIFTMTKLVVHKLKCRNNVGQLLSFWTYQYMKKGSSYWKKCRHKIFTMTKLVIHKLKCRNNVGHLLSFCTYYDTKERIKSLIKYVGIKFLPCSDKLPIKLSAFQNCRNNVDQ